jgi:hypothetical protein
LTPTSLTGTLAALALSESEDLAALRRRVTAVHDLTCGHTPFFTADELADQPDAVLQRIGREFPSALDHHLAAIA